MHRVVPMQSNVPVCAVLRLLRLGFIVLAGLVCADAARAQVEVCADTPAEILNAFDLANDEAVTIKVVQGDYLLPVSPHVRADAGNDYFGHDIRLYGGYSANCSTRSLDPKLTTLRTNSDFHIFTRDSLSVGSIRFRNIPGYLFFVAESAALGPEETVSLSRVWVENVCQPDPVNCGGVNVPLRIVSDHVNLSQLVAVKNASSQCTVLVAGDDLETLVVRHAVFADNDGDGLCAGDALGSDDFSASIANSIFRSNLGTDIRTRLSPNIALRNNIYSELDANPAPDTAPSGTLNVNPLFLDPGASSYSLQGISPAVNSGNIADSVLISEDIDGGPRIVGSAPDRGAYESTVQDNNLLFVTTTADGLSPVPTGSLRAAILASNADGALNTIHFDIAGGCPRIIALAGPLPDITDRVVIDGYTQPGSVLNSAASTFGPTICIGIVGDLSDNHAFQIPASVGAGEYLDLSGVALGGFDVAAIRLSGGTNSRIHGVQFGDELGSTSIPNSAVNIRTAAASRRTVIGGESVADRNLIGEAYVAGIQMLADDFPVDDTDNVVENNMIGTSPGGTLRRANSIGIAIGTGGNVVRDNLISGNQEHGVLIEGTPATQNVLLDNRIGPKASSLVICLPPCPPDFFDLGNVGMGVLVQGNASRNLIVGNTIAYNGGKGIRLFDGQRNAAYTNAIYANGALGIDTGAAGINPFNNDADGAEQATANRGINWPFVASARGTANSGIVRGTVMSTNGTYLLQVFSDSACDVLGHGEARRYHDNASVTIGNAEAGENGTAQFAIALDDVGTLTGRAISVTATDSLGNTSELSNCVVYTLELPDALFGDGFESP